MWFDVNLCPRVVVVIYEVLIPWKESRIRNNCTAQIETSMTALLGALPAKCETECGKLDISIV